MGKEFIIESNKYIHHLEVPIQHVLKIVQYSFMTLVIVHSTSENHPHIQIWILTAFPKCWASLCY